MSAPAPHLERLPDAQQAILAAVKGSGPLSNEELAERLGVTYEAIRQHLSQLERDGWLAGDVERRRERGRPRRLYRLTPAGDHFFPKSYDTVALELLDAMTGELGAGAVKQVLGALVEARVRRLAPRVAGRPLAERLEVLRSLYQTDDPFAAVETAPDGSLRLVERNCPLLELARQRPAVCSVSVSVLSRLLGCKVVREERFQDGAGRCVFRVLPHEPGLTEAEIFQWEPEAGEGATEAPPSAHSLPPDRPDRSPGTAEECDDRALHRRHKNQSEQRKKDCEHERQEQLQRRSQAHASSISSRAGSG